MKLAETEVIGWLNTVSRVSSNGFMCSYIKTDKRKAGKTAQQLKSLAVLAGARVQFLTYTWKLIITCNSSYKDYDAIFWTLRIVCTSG